MRKLTTVVLSAVLTVGVAVTAAPASHAAPEPLSPAVSVPDVAPGVALGNYLYTRGLRGEALRVVWALIMRESAGDATFRSPGSGTYKDGTYDVGLFATNSSMAKRLAAAGYTLDDMVRADATFDFWMRQLSPRADVLARQLDATVEAASTLVRAGAVANGKVTRVKRQRTLNVPNAGMMTLPRGETFTVTGKTADSFCVTIRTGSGATAVDGTGCVTSGVVVPTGLLSDLSLFGLKSWDKPTLNGSKFPTWTKQQKRDWLMSPFHAWYTMFPDVAQFLPTDASTATTRVTVEETSRRPQVTFAL